MCPVTIASFSHQNYKVVIFISMTFNWYFTYNPNLGYVYQVDKKMQESTTLQIVQRSTKQIIMSLAMCSN